LESGIRFFDLRFKFKEDIGQLAVNHGPIYQRETLQHVMEILIQFLITYPSEFLIIRLKKEGRNPRET
jgi:hypothetical protein